MIEITKGGNGRLLARLLDQFELSLAVLDRLGQIVFVNAAFCRMAKLEATSLVGKQCSWKVESDGQAASILTALAPPASALEGRASVRQLTVPIVYGAAETGQLFVPMSDDSGVVQFTLVVLGDFHRIQNTLPAQRRSGSAVVAPDRVLVQLRSRWKTLDHLTAMIGSSTAIALAMLRAQMAVRNPCNLLIHGPAGVGKTEVAQGIYSGRLKAAACPSSSGQFFPLDCRVLDLELIDSMLEIFSGRLQSEQPRVSQHLLLTGVDRLSSAGLERLLSWMDTHQEHCWIMATSSIALGLLAGRSPIWSEIVNRLSTVEIYLPGLAERREDIGALALQSLSEACAQAERAQLLLSADASDRLLAYPWPGNIRQLRDTMKHAVQNAVLTSTIHVEHLPVALRTYCGAVASAQSLPISPIDLDTVLLDVERTLLSRALRLSPRNRAGAARLLGISRPRLLRRIEQLGLESTHRPLDPDAEAE